MIRSFREKDADAVADLLARGPIPEAVSGDGLRHWLERQPERALARMWVAEAENSVVGWARARLRWATSAEGVGEAWAFVAPEGRRFGHGAGLFDAALDHLRSVHARVAESWATEEAGGSFLRARAFEPARTHELFRLDLATADVSSFEEAIATSAAAGYEVVPLAAVVDRAEALYALDAGATADVPATFADDDVRLADWLDEALAHPQLTREGSFVVLAGGEPVAYTFLHVHPRARLAANDMTGTRADHRRRGLARLAKLATIAWAREQGYEAILTACDQDNAGMLHLNRRLGYRHVATETQYRRDDLR